MHVPSVVEIIEVGPRDGLQNEAVSTKSFARIHRRNLISQGPITTHVRH